MNCTRNTLAALALALLAACGGGGEETANTSESAAAPAPAPTAAAATGDTIVIRMVTTQNGSGGQFEPSTVSAKPGDVLKFVSDGGAAHNVDFTSANPGVAGMPPASSYVMANGQSVDVPVTFAPGSYKFVCQPHLATPMEGVLTVT